LVRKCEGKDHLEGLGIDGRIVSKWTSQEIGCELWVELVWRRIVTNNKLWKTFRISSIAEKILASQEEHFFI
jgi:hypothetical protein